MTEIGFAQKGNGPEGIFEDMNPVKWNWFSGNSLKRNDQVSRWEIKTIVFNENTETVNKFCVTVYYLTIIGKGKVISHLSSFINYF